MKRHTCLVLLLTAVASLHAQDYLIRFEGSGEKTNIDSIVVRNLTKGTSIVLAGGEVLHLTGSLNPSGMKDYRMAGQVAIYPNPTDNYAMLEFETPETGNSMVDLFNISGLKLVQKKFYLPPGRHTFQISGITNGIYLLQINAGGYLFSGKLVSTNPYAEEAEIRYISSIINEEGRDQKKGESENGMDYSPGDKLLLTFSSGDYSTTISEVPVQQETIIGNFYACIDADSNSYPVVQIGNQVWMGRNLKTTRFNDGTLIPNVTGGNDWSHMTSPAYSWRNNDEASFKDPYGGLYNWYAINTDKLCPVGWHVPADSEWVALEHYLGGNSISGGKMKEEGTIHWDSPNTGADNSTGFSMVAGGYREGSGSASFYELGRGGYLWSATQYEGMDARYRVFSNTSVNTDRGYSNKNSGFSVRCLMNSGVPVVTTALPSVITDTSAACQGMVSSGDGSDILARGICWDTGSDPDTSSYRVMNEAGGEGVFTCTLARLVPNTMYYARAFAIINAKVFYGNVVSFKSNQYPSLVRDYDGNVYKTVVIGGQTWLAENLKNTHYSNGEPIPNVTSSSEWVSLNSPGYCWRNNDEETYKIPYGALYNWWAVNATSVCPLGFHVATEGDFLNLDGYLGGRATEGAKLKEEGNAHWDSPNAGASNSFGFTMLPGGYRDGQGSAGFYELGRGGYLWSTLDPIYSSGPWYWGFNKDYEQSDRGSSNLTTGFSVRCVNDDSILKEPGVHTEEIKNITKNSAEGGGSAGGPTVFERGVCWSTEPYPDTSDQHTTIWHNTMRWSFRTQFTGLLPGTKYFVRAYAVNRAGVGYGDDIIFKTLPEGNYGSVTDVDGNVYSTIQIGTQTWMRENLKTTKYSDGTEIPNVTENAQWNNLNSQDKAYCFFYNNPDDVYAFGALYTWAAAMNGESASSSNPSQIQGVCPSNWHLPGEDEWKTLESYLGGSHLAGSKMKEFGDAHWRFNEDATNESGFTGLPGGYRSNNSYSDPYGGMFSPGLEDGLWWSTEEYSSNYAHYWKLNYGYPDLFSGNSDLTKGSGISVRCVKNEIDTTGQVNLKKGLVAWYPFNGNANDESGNGHDGVVNGATLTADRFGNPNQAYFFNGKNNTISVTGFNLSRSAATITCWVKPTSGDGVRDIISKHLAVGDVEILIRYEFGKYRIVWDIGNDNTFFLSDDAGDFFIDPNNPCFDLISLTYNGQEACFYINNKLIETYKITGSIANNKYPMVFGQYASYPSVYDESYDGVIDEIRVYNRALNVSEIQALYDDRDKSKVTPELLTLIPNFITQTSAISGCRISNQFGELISSKGICWNTSPDPDTSDFKMDEGNGNNSFTSTLYDLMPNTLFYVRAYVVYGSEISFGNEISFRTLPEINFGNVSDADGNTYKTVMIGEQSWFAENLKTTKYSDGSLIPTLLDDNEWLNATAGAYCWFKNDSVGFKNPYGALYNWYSTVDERNLCPVGWHIPSLNEWQQLATYLGGENIAGGKLKEAGLAHWDSPNFGASNLTGFTGLPGGGRAGDFGLFGGYGSFWAIDSGNAWIARLEWANETLNFILGNPKAYGMSVRCIKDGP